MVSLCCAAVEWLGHMQGSRTVVITLDETKQRIVVKESNKVVRCIDLSRLEKTTPVTFMLSADVQMKLMLIRVPKEYDMVRSLPFQPFFNVLVWHDTVVCPSFRPSVCL